jgi:endoglucanase
MTQPRAALPPATHSRLPRWRGFNLQGRYSLQHSNPGFQEDEFQLISDWGFNFARLPMDYRIWSKNGDWNVIDEAIFKDIDRAVGWGKKYGLHICLNVHRAPGYCINLPKESRDLWTEREVQDVFAKHWAFFARRYQGIPNDELSFDLLNEPNGVDSAAYAKVVQVLVEAIRAEDPRRLIIADGLDAGATPVPELIPFEVAQGARGYQPMPISHHQASWFPPAAHFPPPAWPLRHEGVVYDKAWLRKNTIEPWKALEAQGVGVVVGEWGCHNKTPHGVVLAWMEDQLQLWKEAGWGWALWNLKGNFGVMDSNRADVAYEGFKGHGLDRKMLDLLLRY